MKALLNYLNTNRTSVTVTDENLLPKEKLKVHREKLKNYTSQFQQEFAVVTGNTDRRKVNLPQNDILISTITT